MGMKSTSIAEETILAILNGPSNFIDTSRNYGMGRSEKLIGNVFKSLGGKPNDIILPQKLIEIRQQIF